VYDEYLPPLQTGKSVRLFAHLERSKTMFQLHLLHVFFLYVRLLGMRLCFDVHVLLAQAMGLAKVKFRNGRRVDLWNGQL
jgi:hypothetical protein